MKTFNKDADDLLKPFSDFMHGIAIVKAADEKAFGAGSLPLIDYDLAEKEMAEQILRNLECLAEQSSPRLVEAWIHCLPHILDQFIENYPCLFRAIKG